MYYKNTDTSRQLKKELIKSDFVSGKVLNEYTNANSSGAATLDAAPEKVSNILGKKTTQRILGNKREQKNLYGITKTSVIKNIREKSKQVFKSTTKSAAEKVISPKQHIKNLAKMTRMQELVMNTDKMIHEEIIKNVGQTGVRMVVSIVVSVVKVVIKTIIRLLMLLAGVLGIYMFIIIAFVAILSMFFTASYGSNRDGTSQEIVASQLEEPRLNAEGILTNEWYVGTVNPFTAAGFGVVRYGIDSYGNSVTYYGNCTAYAWGRWAEILGYAPSLPTGNAGTWYDANVTSGNYDYGQEAKVGAIACWRYSNGGPGHVAVIETINSDGSIIMSESRYNGGTRRDIDNLFYLRFFTNAESVKNLWIFQGYIYLPVEEE